MSVRIVRTTPAVGISSTYPYDVSLGEKKVRPYRFFSFRIVALKVSRSTGHNRRSYRTQGIFFAFALLGEKTNFIDTIFGGGNGVA